MNGKNVLSVLRNKMSGACALTLLALTLVSGNVLAQDAGFTPQTVNVQGMFSWDGVQSTLFEMIAVPLGIGITVALAIWVALFCLRLLKRSAN